MMHAKIIVNFRDHALQNLIPPQRVFNCV